MTRTRVVLSALFAGLFVTTVIVACAGGEAPTEVPAPPPGVTGADLLQERCTACHGVNRVEGESGTQAEWEATVERMREYGAELTDEEAQTLVQYLVENYGP